MQVYLQKYNLFSKKKSLLYFPPILPTASWAEFSPRYCFLAWLKRQVRRSCTLRVSSHFCCWNRTLPQVPSVFRLMVLKMSLTFRLSERRSFRKLLQSWKSKLCTLLMVRYSQVPLLRQENERFRYQPLGRWKPLQRLKMQQGSWKLFSLPMLTALMKPCWMPACSCDSQKPQRWRQPRKLPQFQQ